MHREKYPPTKGRRDIGSVDFAIEKMMAAREASSCCVGVDALLEIDSKELIRLWSADKVYDIIAEEEEATQILNVVAESIVKYKRKSAKV